MCGGRGAVTVTSPPLDAGSGSRARARWPLADVLVLEERGPAAVLAVTEDRAADQQCARSWCVRPVSGSNTSTRRGGRRVR